MKIVFGSFTAGSQQDCASCHPSRTWYVTMVESIDENAREVAIAGYLKNIR
nr:hypothetical protein [Planctomicrobium sp.]